jgi:hypothetical protein
MKALNILPDGYGQIYEIDLQKNKRKMLLVNGIALLISALMVVPMCFYIPITELFSFEKGILQYFIRFAALFGLSIVYMVLHELVHGITMKLCGTKRVKYGFTGLYAFAGSDDYYDKKSYITIALAPIVLWGVVIAIINCFVPREWFWVVYFLQIMNISGAAGDMYVTFKFSKMPKDILVRDYGVGMKVYSKIIGI